MMHWTDPEQRGVYEHPSAHPPPASHRSQNDLASRLARVEEHLNFGAWNLRRVETDGRLRDTDIIRGLRDGLRDINRRLMPIEKQFLASSHVRKATRRMGISILSWLRYLIAGVLAILMLTGKASLEHVKLILGALGFPSG